MADKLIEIKKKEYEHFKSLGNDTIKDVLTEDWGSFEDQKEKLFMLAGDEGMVEIGSAYGDGDNGTDYYRAHLMLNPKNFLNKDFDNVLYLIFESVPVPDGNYKPKLTEFSKLTELNFMNGLVLLEYMRRFTNPRLARLELERLSERRANTCVKVTDQGGVSFY